MSSANSAKVANNSENNSGWLGKIDVFGLLANNKNNSKKNNSSKNTKPTAEPISTPPPTTAEPVKPVTAGVNIPTAKGGMRGGMAPVNFRYPANMQQPSEKIMQWATTAGLPTPTGPEMRNVAHGGKRRSHRNKTSGGSRRNRNRSRRNKTSGGSRRNKRNATCRRNRRN